MSFTDKKVYIIVAADEKNGIGKEGKLPWSLKKEMGFFRDTTSETFETDVQNMVIMGRTTWESLPEQFRPLPDRRNAVLTHNRNYKAEGADVYFSLGEALKKADMDETIETIFIIGGAQIYELAMDVADGIYLTRIQKDFNCDAFFPQIDKTIFYNCEEMGTEEEDGIKYSFNFYSKGLDVL